MTALDTPVSPCDILVPLTPISQWLGLLVLYLHTHSSLKVNSGAATVRNSLSAICPSLFSSTYSWRPKADWEWGVGGEAPSRKMEAEGRLGMGGWGAEPPNGGMPAIPNSGVISITPELLFPRLGVGEKHS